MSSANLKLVMVRPAMLAVHSCSLLCNNSIVIYIYISFWYFRLSLRPTSSFGKYHLVPALKMLPSLVLDRPKLSLFVDMY